MLPRWHRLTSEKDIKRVFRKGAVFFSPYLVLKKVASGKPGASRFAVVVSQKLAKKATQRNRIRRVIYEIIRLKLAKIKNGSDCIIIPKKTEKVANFSEKTKDLETLLQRAKII